VLPTLIYSTGTGNIGNSKAMVGQILAAGLIALWLLWRVRDGRLATAVSPVNLPLAAVLAVGLVSLARAPYPQPALLAAGRYGAGLLIIWLFACGVRRRGECLLLMRVLTGVAIICIAYALLQHAGYDFIKRGGMPWTFAMFLCPCGLAEFLALTLPLMLAVGITAGHWSSRIVIGGALAAAAWILTTLSTPSAWHALGAALAVMALASVGFLRRHLRWLVAALALCSILLPLQHNGRVADINRIFTGYADEIASEQFNALRWLGALRLLAEQPLLGQGIGMAEIMFPRVRPAHYSRIGLSHTGGIPKGELPRIAAEQGALGLLLTAWFWLTLLVTISSWRDDGDRRWQWLRSGMLGAAMAAVLLLNDPAHPHELSGRMTVFAVIGLALAGAQAKAAWPAAMPTVVPPVRRRLMVPVAVAAFAAVLLVGWNEWRLLSSGFLKSRADTILNIATADRPDWRAGTAAFEQALTANPRDPSLLHKLAYTQLQDSRPAAALATYRKLMAVSPHYAQVHYNAGMTELMLGDTLAAVGEYELAAQFEEICSTRIVCGQLHASLPHPEQRRAAGQYLRAHEYVIADVLGEYSRSLRQAAQLAEWQRYGKQELYRDTAERQQIRLLQQAGQSWAAVGAEQAARHYARRAAVWERVTQPQG